MGQNQKYAVMLLAPYRPSPLRPLEEKSLAIAVVITKHGGAASSTYNSASPAYRHAGHSPQHLGMTLSLDLDPFILTSWWLNRHSFVVGLRQSVQSMDREDQIQMSQKRRNNHGKKKNSNSEMCAHAGARIWLNLRTDGEGVTVSTYSPRSQICYY